MNVDRLIFLGVILLTVCRWFLAASLELTAEEALYWVESKRPAPFYVDHGPVIAGVVQMGVWALGDSLLGIRYLNPLLILLATWLLFLLARSVSHQVAARWSVVVFQLCPVVNVAAVFMIDVALALCLVLFAGWCLWCGLHRVHRWHGYWWAGGVALGLAMTLSLPLAGTLGGVALALSLTSRWRDQWGRPGIWLLLVLAVVIPGGLVFYSGHGGLALRAQLNGLGFRPGQLMQGLGQWIFWTGPLLALGLAWLGLRPRRLRRDHGAIFLLLLGLVPLVTGFVWSGLAAPWPYAAWVGTPFLLVVLVGQWMQADVDLERKGRWRRWTLLSTGGLAILGVNTANLAMLGLPWPLALTTPRLEQGWMEASEAVEATLLLAAARQPQGLLVIAEDPQTAALLDFYLSPEALVYRPHEAYPRIHVVESAGLASVYDLWPSYSHALPGSQDPSPFQGLMAIYVTRDSREGELPPNLVHAFKSAEPAAVLDIKRRGRLLHRWRLFHVYQYKGLPR